MKTYVHARLDPGDRARLDELKQVTGEPETALVKKGLRLVHEREVQGRRKRTALEIAGKLVLGQVAPESTPIAVSLTYTQLAPDFTANLHVACGGASQE